MDQKHHTSSLLFIHPQDPSKSFSYDMSNSKEETSLTIIKAIEKERQCYFDFTDFFGRRLPGSSSEDFFKALQPFYIKKMIPKIANLYITLPMNGQKLLLRTDPEMTLAAVKKFMEEKIQIPFEQQKYFIGENKLFDDIKLVDQGVVEKDVEMRLELKPNFIIKCPDGTIFEIYLDLKETGNELVRTIRRKKQELLGIDFSVFCNEGDVPLDVDKILAQNSFKSGDVLYVRQKIQVSIVGMNLQESFAPSMKILDVKEYLMSQKDELFGEEFDLSYNKMILEEDQSLWTLKNIKIELQITPKSGFLLVHFVSLVDIYSPSLIIFDKSQTLSNMIKHTFKRHYREDLCVFYHKGKIISHEQVLKDLCPPEKDTIELTYKISWDQIYSGFQFYLITLKGQKITVFGNPWDTIERLRTQIYDRISLPPDQQKIIFAGRQVEDNKTLSDYNIQTDSVLHLVLRTTGGGGGGSADFLDITQSQKAKCFEWTDGAPAWRMAKRGLCLEGKCYNRSCTAFGRWVIISKGMGTYDVVADVDKNQCPMCLQLVSVEKCAFNNCRYGYSGINLQEDGMALKKVITQEEIEVGDFYKVLDPEIVGRASWKVLIVTKNVDDKTAKNGVICGICREEVKVEGKILEECNHIFHEKCLENIKDVVSDCVYCRF